MRVAGACGDGWESGENGPISFDYRCIAGYIISCDEDVANAWHRKPILRDCGRVQELAKEHRAVGRKVRRDAR